MSHIANILTRPSTLGAISVAGSGAFYLGLKYRTFKGPPEVQKNSKSRVEDEKRQEYNYEVKPGREGGGV